MGSTCHDSIFIPHQNGGSSDAFAASRKTSQLQPLAVTATQFHISLSMAASTGF